MKKKGLTLAKLKKAKKILDNAPPSKHLYKQVATGKMYYIFPCEPKKRKAR